MSERRLRAYRAEDNAQAYHPPTPLDGSQKAAQAYVDRITRSAWWRRTCPPSWRGDDRDGSHFLRTDAPPRRVIVRTHPQGGASAYTETLRKHRGKWFPWISLGTQPWDRHGNLSPAQNPWTILHELAHLMAASAGTSGHGREFARFYVLLVRRWIGPAEARMLKAALRAEGLSTTQRPARAASRR